MFLKILLSVIGFAFFLLGVRIAFFPRKFVKAMMNYKYKTKIEPQKNAVIFAVIMGGLLMITGGYYTILGILLLIEG
ncbi:MAG: hypothetical protein PHW21_02310 [Candidatus Izemoplasmatales bacterium]|nr:hypothetical protein [Candidatus Izemoplasmatales bacterium]